MRRPPAKPYQICQRRGAKALTCTRIHQPLLVDVIWPPLHVVLITYLLLSVEERAAFNKERVSVNKTRSACLDLFTFISSLLVLYLLHGNDLYSVYSPSPSLHTHPPTHAVKSQLHCTITMITQTTVYRKSTIQPYPVRDAGGVRIWCTCRHNCTTCPTNMCALQHNKHIYAKHRPSLHAHSQKEGDGGEGERCSYANTARKQKKEFPVVFYNSSNESQRGCERGEGEKNRGT